MARLTIPGWSDFQHYKDRNPAWIKLHKRLLDNFDFHCLPVASRALAPMLWLLASESNEGSIDYASNKLAFRLRMDIGDFEEALKPLISASFVELDQSDSVALAERKQESIPEREEETQGKTESEKEYSGDFENCWAEYPKRSGSNDKKAAFRAYSTRLKEGHAPADILAGVKRYAAWCRHTGKINTETVKQAATFFGPADPPCFTEGWSAPGMTAPVAESKPLPFDESLEPFARKLMAIEGVPAFNSWFAGCIVVEKEDWITLSAPTSFAAAEIRKRYTPQLKKIFGDQFQVGHGRPKVDA